MSKTDSQLKPAEDATKRVHGVSTVAEIAAAAQSALEWDIYVPKAVTAKVDHGAVTLSGLVAWNYQREAAARSGRPRSTRSRSTWRRRAARSRSRATPRHGRTSRSSIR